MKSLQGKWSNSNRVEALRNPAPGRPRTGSPNYDCLPSGPLFSAAEYSQSQIRLSIHSEVTVLFQNSFLISLAVKCKLLLWEIFDAKRDKVTGQFRVHHKGLRDL
jgi:hypothetical protein